MLFLARKALEPPAHRYGDAVVPLESARTVAAAALLHDVGHYPFSHAIEEWATRFVRTKSSGAT